MEDNKDNFGFGDPEEIRKQYELEDDSDTLEPFVDDAEHREVNTDDEADLKYWAEQFQVSVEELKAAIALNGSSVKAIKKYLSV